MQDSDARSEEAWLFEWFAERDDSIELKPDENYFDAGAIDSFGAIELIEAIESRFEIRLTESDFQDRRFATVGGLAEIIRSRRS